MRGEHFYSERLVLGEPYSRKEIAAAGRVEQPTGPRDPYWSTGIVSFENAILLLVTLEKDEFDYVDYFEGGTFWWQSQTRQTQASEQIQRIAADGLEVLLFVRIHQKVRGQTMPFIYAGRLTSPLMSGERPVTVAFVSADFDPYCRGALAEIYRWRPAGGRQTGRDAATRRDQLRAELEEGLPHHPKKGTDTPAPAADVARAPKTSPFLSMRPVAGPLPTHRQMREALQLKIQKSDGTGKELPTEDSGIESNYLEQDGQGRLPDSALRKQIELYAMRFAADYYLRAEWKVSDTSAYKPYDLLCRRDGRELRVEVKGTQCAGEAILVTANEIKSAREAATALFIVYGITIESREPLHLSGGSIRLIPDWYPRDDDLTPTAFTYRVTA
jgi:hypothetical protein